MDRIVRKLSVFALVFTMLQSGLVQWMPHSGAKAAQKGGTSLAHAGHGHERAGTVHDDPPEGKAKAPPVEEYGERCVRPTPGCECPGCTDYFASHFLTLPHNASPPHIPRSAVYENIALALIASTDSAPPTPPPRS